MKRATKYVALDVHQAMTVASVREQSGRVIARSILPTEEATIIEFLQGMRGAIRFVTPDQRHFGQEEAILANRHRVYEEARRRNPERWSGSVRDWSPIGVVRLKPERQLAEKAEKCEAA